MWRKAKAGTLTTSSSFLSPHCNSPSCLHTMKITISSSHVVNVCPMHHFQSEVISPFTSLYPVEGDSPAVIGCVLLSTSSINLFFCTFPFSIVLENAKGYEERILLVTTVSTELIKYYSYGLHLALQFLPS